MMKRLYILLILLTAAFWGRAQIYQQENLFGKEAWRYVFKAAVGIPNDTIAPPVAYQSYPHLAAKDSILYVWSPSGKRFRAISAAASGGGGGSYTFLAPLSNDGGVVSLTSVPWSLITGKPSTLSGYGITDAVRVSDTADMLLGYMRKGVAGSAGHTHIGADITDGTTWFRNMFSGGTGVVYNNATGVIAIDSALVKQWLSASTYTFTGPLSETGGTVSITQAGGSTNGYLSAVDWTLFNGKVSQDALDDTASALRALIAAATPDSFTYATRRYVDSSVSALPTLYTANGTLSGNRTVTMGSYGLNFYKDASNYTNLTGAAFDARRGNVYTYFENGFGQMRIRTSGFEYNAWNNVYSNNDSSFTAGIYSSNEKTYNWKQAQFEANWQDGAAWKVAAYWKTNSTLSGMKGWTMRHTSTDGQAEIHTDRETFTVGSSTDSALVRKSDGTIGLYPVSGGGGASLPTLSTLTDGATVTWDYSTQGTEAKVTLAGNRTLSITNLPAGEVVYLTLEVIQDATGSRTLTLPASTKVIGGGAGAVTLTTTGGATDLLTFRWNGTTLFANLGTNYN